MVSIIVYSRLDRVIRGDPKQYIDIDERKVQVPGMSLACVHSAILAPSLPGRRERGGSNFIIDYLGDPIIAILSNVVSPPVSRTHSHPLKRVR